jgi:hypothetical protein
MDLDFVEGNSGFVSICKEAILGSCSTNECKFIIYVSKNFNSKFFIIIITKIGVQTSVPLLQQIAHISRCFLFFFIYIFLTNKYVRPFYFLFYTKHNGLSSSFLHPSKHVSFFFLYMFMISIFCFICSFVRCNEKSSTVHTHRYINMCMKRETSDL